MEATAWTLRRDEDDIAWLVFDKPASSANTLGRGALVELGSQLETLERRRPRGLVIKSAKLSGFIAGADVREFTGLTTEAQALELIRLGQRTLARIEALSCPSVAALHGFALGGGLELALACRYRVAVGDARLALGFPEVQLGIQPGFGGSVRSVRLLGVRAAMEMMLTGKSLRAEKALAIGLVDRLVTAPELDAAARALILSPPAPHRPPLLERVLCWPGVRKLVKPMLVKQVARRARRDHYPAPYAIIDRWVENGVRGSAAFDAEAQSIAQLMNTETARSLVRMFLLQDRLKSLAGHATGELRRVHVVGAGVMGGDIAAWCALRGLDVTLQDREMKYIEPAVKRAGELFAKRLRDPAERAQAASRLVADVAGDGIGNADLIIEAIFEDLEAKRALFQAAEPRLQPQAVLASNTSSITLESIAEPLANPGRLVGLHFFNPVAQMPLVEVIQSSRSEPSALATAMAFARRIDKLPLPCRSAPGFLVNRVLFPYLHEALHAAGEGVPLPLIDQVAVEFGMPMGPIELADVVGLDVVLHVGEIINRELGREDPPMIEQLRQMVAEHKLGRKTGSGFYPWQDGKVQKPAAPGRAPEDLTDRLVLALVNECVACLREGVVADADLIDAGVVFGAGFAPFRGGPLNYARRRGTATVVARLQELATRHGQRFQPDSGWPQFTGT